MQPAALNRHLAYLLTAAEREVTRRLAESLRGEGASVEQWRVLQALSDGHGHAMGELADVVAMNHPTLTKLIDRMVSDNLVYRAHDLADRRRVAVFLSERGRALLGRLEPLARRHQQEITAVLGVEDTRRLAAMLAELRERLTATGSAAAPAARPARDGADQTAPRSAIGT